MKVLITGATGFLGSWMTKRLLDEGFEVSALVRSKHKLETELPGLKVQAIEGDVTDLASLQRATRGQESVFHLAGLIAYSHAQRAAMENVNVQGTANVIRAMQENGCGRLLHLSSVTAIGAGFTPSEILDETSKFNVGHLNLGYFETKRAAEELVFKACRETNFDAVAVNPSTIYGPGDAKKGSRGAQLKVARGTLPFYPSGGVNIVHVDDVVDLCIKVFRTGRSGERTIACGENLLIKDAFERIAKAAGVKPPAIPLPRFAAFALGRIGDALESIGKKGPLNTENAWTSVLYHWFKNDKARREFGFQPKSADSAIEASVRWSKENGVI